MKITVHDYSDLFKWVRGFANGHFECLILVSWPGTGKTTMLEDALKDQARILKGGQLTAFRFYQELYLHRNRLIVVDDIDRLYRDRETVSLLKCVANTDAVKVIGWHSSTHKLGTMPTEFETTSKIAITANDWKALNKNLDAVENRGFVVSFEPTALAVHAEAIFWFKQQDEEVFRFVGRNLYLIKEPSFRHYLTAAQAKKAGLNWKAAFLESLNLKPHEALVARLKVEPYSTEEDRVKEFIRISGMHRATYFRIASKLEMMRQCDHDESQSRMDPNLSQYEPPPLKLNDDLDQFQPEKLP